MTTPVIEKVRTIPLIIEQSTYIPMAVDGEDEDNTGFPFDRDLDRGRRDEAFRSQLDDLAKRHPEIAGHFESFPFRSDSSGSRSRTRYPEEFRTFTERPFGSSRFERFGFPFDRDPFQEDSQNQPQQQPQQSSQASQPQQETAQQEPVQQEPEAKQQHPQQERGRKQNIQQSNTVDLGQKQEPVNDQRNQRSMSAPPPDNRSAPRYVSSINIPINRESGMSDMGSQQSQPQPQPQQQQSNKSTERIIPIHIEGRDEPVIPKSSGPSFTQQPPQPERIFGQRPSQFTQYVGRESPKQFGGASDWHHPNYAEQAKPQDQQPKFHPHQQEWQIPVQRETPKHQQQPPQPQSQPQQVPEKSNNSIDMIQSIQKDVSQLMAQVEKFSGVPRDKQYLYLDEMLTRNLIKLDNIDTQGQENIRQARKEAIKCIEKCISILDAKAAANVPQEAKPTTENMEIETNGDESQSQPEEKPVDQPTVSVVVEQKEEKMEVEQEKSVENIGQQEPSITESPAATETKKDEQQKEELQQSKSEEKMEVVETQVLPDPPSKENQPEPPSEPQVIENKSSEESKQATTQEENEKSEDVTNQSTSEKDTKSEDKKDKKKGKKKNVKKQ